MRPVLAAVVALALVVSAACGAVLALFTRPAFDLLGFHPVALDFFEGVLTRIELEQTVIDGQTFGPAEIDHLVDVAAMLQALTWIFVLAIVVLVVAVLAAPGILRRAANFGLAGLALLGLIVVGGYFAFGFETVGVLFHEILFPQGNWRFPWHTLIIRLYGTDVMVTGAAFVIALGLGTLAAIFVATRFMAREQRPQAGETG